MTIDDLYTQIYPVRDPELKKEIIDLTEVRKVKKHELVFRQDENDTSVCFLKNGVGIAYEIYSDGKTVCLSVFDRPGDIVVGGLGMNASYSPVNVMMQTPGELFCVRMQDMVRFQEEYPEIMMFYNQILLKEYENQWQVKNMLYMDAAEDRYAWFLKHHPGTIDKISHKNIASFLHMSPVTLSRVRNKVGGNE